MIITNINDYLFEQLLNETMMTEKINIDKLKGFISKITNKKEVLKTLINKFNKTTNLNSKKMIGITIVMLYFSGFVIKNNKWTSSKEYNDKIEDITSNLISLSNNGDIKETDINDIFSLDFMKKNEPKSPIISIDRNIINSVNNIKPGRLDITKIKRYDQYDEEILSALKELERKGEVINPNLIKTIMLIETGMKPVKNSLGYEGFPQTKEHIINGWIDSKGKFHPGINQKHGTNFTMSDMYNPGKAAQFIHYYLKTVGRSSYVKDNPDLLIAYNWGIGNLYKYKNGKKNLPKQTEDYVKIYKAIEPYFGDYNLGT